MDDDKYDFDSLLSCDSCPPPDYMMMPPPPPPPHLQELCHYEGDCGHHPIISNIISGNDFIHIISLILITSLTIIIVFSVSCIIVYR